MDDMGSSVLLHPRKGDAILFDQRLIHRGQALDSAAGQNIFAANTRMTLQLSFGVEHNRITNEWAKGELSKFCESLILSFLSSDFV